MVKKHLKKCDEINLHGTCSSDFVHFKSFILKMKNICALQIVKKSRLKRRVKDGETYEVFGNGEKK